MAARPLQRTGPLDVGLLVEARLDLDERHDLLAGLGRVDQRVHDRRVTRRAVERLLDRQDVRVGSGLLDEALDGRRERVVRVVDEHVAVAQRREHRLRRLALGEARVRRRDEGLVLERRAVDVVDLPQRAEIEQARHAQDVLVVDLDLAGEQVEHLVVDVVGDLEPHGRPELAPHQLALERLQEVLVAVLLDLEVGVARDAEQVVLDDLHAREQHRQVLGDEVLDRQELGLDGRLRHDHEARDVVGHLDPREALRADRAVADEDGEVQRLPGDVGERVRRVDGQRRQHREDLAAEVLAEAALLLVVEVTPPADVDALVVEGGGHVVLEAPRVTVDDLGDAGRQRGEDLARRQAVRGRHLQSHVRAALQPGDAHHVELVEVAREDREVLHALQQRLRRVLGQREDALVERQPRQLTVAEPVLRQVGSVVRRRVEIALRDGVRGLDQRFGRGHDVIMPRPDERRLRRA